MNDPIHSDPAGESRKDKVVEKWLNHPTMIATKNLIEGAMNEWGEIKYNQGINHANEYHRMNPQTGRTYTQKDVDEAYDKGYRDGVIYRVANH